jgi:hypothetical protein
MSTDTQVDAEVADQTKKGPDVPDKSEKSTKSKSRNTRYRRGAVKKPHQTASLIAVRQDSGIMEASFAAEGGSFVVRDRDGKRSVSWYDSGNPEAEIHANPGVVREDDPNRVKIGKLLIRHLKDFLGRVNKTVYDISLSGDSNDKDDPAPPAEEEGDSEGQL